MGIKDQPKKIAGVRFQGKKTFFGNSDDEDSADDVMDSADFGDNALEMENAGEQKVDDKDSADSGFSGKRKRDNTLEMKDFDEQKVKLKKLCKRFLHQVQHPTC